MEENTTTSESNKISSDQLRMIALQMQQKAMQAEARLNEVNFAAMRLDYLFKVLDREHCFSIEFVSACAREIQDILEVKTLEAENPDTKD